MNTQVAVVVGVGAEQGIGAAVSRRFAQSGLKVYVVGRTLNKLQAVTQTIAEQGGSAVAYCLDAENDQQIQSLFDMIIANNEQLEVVAHNVGGNIPSLFLKTQLSFFQKCGARLSYLLIWFRSLV